MKQDLFSISWGYTLEKKGESEPLFEQVHGNTLIKFENPLSPDKSLEKPLPKADGGIAFFSKARLHVYTADCFPVLFFTEDPQSPIAAVHAGWKGIKLGIVQKALSEFGNISNVHAVLGPAIGPCCFAVREDFIQEWESAQLAPAKFLALRNGRQYFDLLKYVTSTALAPLPSSRIHLDGFRCTVCSQPPLPSFRRNKSANPRIKTWIEKKT